MKSEFMIAITQLAAEKNLPKEVVLDAMEAALVSAYKKDSALEGEVAVKINRETGDHHVYLERNVVQEVEDPLTEITLPDARKVKPDVMPGDVLLTEVHPGAAGRIAAQTAKQVVLQRLREAERAMVFEEFSNREGDIVSGVIQRIEEKHTVVDLGKTEGVFPLAEQVRSENYRVGQRLKFYLLEVHKSLRGPQLILSRTHKNLLRRLFELEVPEIYRGIVEIKSIAREAGYRSKVAVAARQEGVDPVGSCVGLRGIRIQNIVNELNGERIDVIQWDPEAARLVANALSPAQVLSVKIDEVNNTGSVIVPDRQLSLAIGKEGQNARLAAKLTGWRIDIKPESAITEPLEPLPEPTKVISGPAPTIAPEVTEEDESAATEPASHPEAPQPWEEVITADDRADVQPVEASDDKPAELVAEAPAQPEAESNGAPAIRFAEEIGPVVADEPAKGKKKGKKAQESEAAAKAAAKRSRHLAVAEESEDEDLEYDWKADE
ncbi:MAG: transcription termination/antitermination protein NusA [Chloroflexi bacterium]|nr:transcription termination/antitermination protein NusA [Chloroflexota bacterium]